MAIKEVKAHYTATIREAEAAGVEYAHTLQQSLGESMQDLECEAIEKEEWDCQSFLEACRAALQVCPSIAHGVLMYPLQLLTGNMSLADLLMTTPQLAIAIGKPTPATPPPTMSETPAPPMGTKWWCLLSDREAASPKIRGGRSCGIRPDPGEVAPLKAERWEASSNASEGEPPQSLRKGLWPGADDQAELLQNASPRIQP